MGQHGNAVKVTEIFILHVIQVFSPKCSCSVWPLSTNSNTKRTYPHEWQNNYWARRFTKSSWFVSISQFSCLSLSSKGKLFESLSTIVNFLINFPSLFKPVYILCRRLSSIGFHLLYIEAKVARISAVINIILIYKGFSVRPAIAFFQFPLRDYICGYILTRLKFLMNIGLVE